MNNSTLNTQHSTLLTLLLALGIISGIAVLYFDTFVRLVKNLFTYQGSHGLLILAVSLYLVWKKRDLLRRFPIQPNLIYGTVLTAFGCFVFLSGKLSSTQLLQQVSLISTLLGVIWLILGGRYFRALLVPVGYMIFMFGFFEEILSNISIYFQYVAAWIASNILKPTGWPIFLEGHIIALPHISLRVTRACNGINHIISLVALSVPIAIMTQRTLTRKMGLILVVFLIGIFANGLRVALIGVWTYYSKGGPTHGPYDIFYVSFIFFFGMVLLLLMSRFKREPPPRQVPTPVTRNNDHHIPPHALPLMLSIGLLILFSTIGFLYFYKPIPVSLSKPLPEFPMTIGEWTGKDVSYLDANIFKDFSADMELKRIYSNHSMGESKLYIGYFAAQQQGRKVIDYRFEWLHINAQVVKIPLSGGEIIQVKKITSPDKNPQDTIYFWYDINGRNVVGRYKTKLAVLINAFTMRRTNAAIVIISIKDGRTPDGDQKSNDVKLIQTLFPTIRKYLETS